MADNPLAQYLPPKNEARDARIAELRASTQGRQAEIDAIGQRVEAREERRAGLSNPLAGYLPGARRAASPPAPEGMGVGEMAAGAWENLVPSAKRFAQDIARVVTHPVETAEGLGNLIIGTGQLAIPGEQGKEQYAREVGNFFADRYGGLEELKRTIATDPVGFAADAATVLTGGGALAARAPGMAGKVGQVAATAGRAMDPTTAGIRGVKKAGRAIGTAAAAIPGMTTGAGTKAVRTAVTSGVAGGDLGAKFRAGMRGDVPMEEVVNDAREAVANLYRRRSEQYRRDMAAVNKDPTILDFDRVDDALKEIGEVKRFRGVAISRSTEGVRTRIKEIVDQWRGLDPAQYHTVEGFDALKQALGDVMDSTQYGSPEWRVANEAYQAVKRTIVYQAPEYAKAMKNYEQATALLKEMQGELSLGKGKSAGAALRKLQSIIRDDVSSAYGRRAELGAELEKAGARGLEETLAGHAMSSVLPRGLRGSVVGGGTTAGLGIAGGANPAALAAAGLVGAASSPRLVGEVAHAGGRIAGPVARAARALPDVPAEIPPAAYQASRASGVASGERMTAADAAEAEREQAILSEYPDAQRAADGSYVVWRSGRWNRIVE